jgi:hypothetical protein
MKFSFSLGSKHGWVASFWLFLWLLGVVAAKGFVSTCVAIVCFPWAWYLAVEKLMQALGVV